ncbi:MAG: hypothetical protein ABIK43_02835 [candidate division WOR-3 bacterium]
MCMWRVAGVLMVLLVLAAGASAAGGAQALAVPVVSVVSREAGGQTDAVTIPRLINYQGRLTDSAGKPLNEAVNMTFAIYEGTTQIWTETQNNVQVRDGVFNVLLGSVNPISSLPEAGNCSLQVTVNSEVIAPKIPLVSVPYTYYAQKSDDADRLGGTAAAQYIRNGTTADGDLDGTYPNPMVGGLQGRPVASTAPSAGQVLKWSGSQWAPAADVVGDTSYWSDFGTYIEPKQNSGVRVYDAGQSYGIYGYAASGIGLYGYTGSGSSYGVYGYAPNSSMGIGVCGYGYQMGVYAINRYSAGYGVFANSPWCGVYGYGSGGFGVYGHGGQMGVYGFCANSGQYAIYSFTYNGYTHAVYGSNGGTGCRGILGPSYSVVSNYVGVYGYSSNSYSYGVYGYCGGSYGYGVCGAGMHGVVGVGTARGVEGDATASDGQGVLGFGYLAGGYFHDLSSGYLCRVAYESYKVYGSGAVSTYIIDENDQERTLHCPETPEVLFEDVGTAQLRDGYCRVDIDPLLLRGIVINEDHPLRIFVQLHEGGLQPRIVRANTYFEVYALDSISRNSRFDWRIVANRRGYEDLRFEAHERPPERRGKPEPTPKEPWPLEWCRVGSLTYEKSRSGGRKHVRSAQTIRD